MRRRALFPTICGYSTSPSIPSNEDFFTKSYLSQLQVRSFLSCSTKILLSKSFHSVATSPSLEGCAALMHIDPSINMARYLLEMSYRSSYARELLKERIKEPSVELALRELTDYTALRGKYQEPLASKLLAADDVEKIQLLLDDFERWYYQLRAPEKIKMSEPWSWFPKARQMRRNFIFHAGPTNSGKTHAALQRLTTAKSGVYCAPLKALAAQVWRRIDSTVPCDLLIGDERQFAGSAEHVSCTMEMTPVDFSVDVGVIDEIQMIGDRDRGWAWSRALLGLPAKEIHLCGEERALHVVKALLRHTREDRHLTVVKHKRLVGLQMGPSLGGSYAGVQNGDCVVAFSRKSIFNIKAEIEVANPKAKVNVIYGGLPFNVRESESDAFNDGVKAAALHNNRNGGSSPPPPPPHVLVTTDAIAYGLNMNIRRIVFSTMRKFDGNGMRNLPDPLILQVGGRAGRFGMVFGGEGSDGAAEGGLVTTLFPKDLAAVRKAFSAPMSIIKSAGLLPTADILALFAEMTYGRGGGTNATPQQQIPFSKVIEDFATQMNYSADGTFFPCDMTRSVVAISRYLDEVRADTVIDEAAIVSTTDQPQAVNSGGAPTTPPDNTITPKAFSFPISDKIIFCFCPMSEGSDRSGRLLQAYAFDHAQGGPVRVRLDVILERLEKAKVDSADQQQSANVHAALSELEWIYRMAEVYGWLSWRFGKTFVGGQELGKAIKDRCSEEIKRRLAALPRSDKNSLQQGQISANRSHPSNGHNNSRDADIIAPIPLADMGATGGHPGGHYEGNHHNHQKKHQQGQYSNRSHHHYQGGGRGQGGDNFNRSNHQQQGNRNHNRQRDSNSHPRGHRNQHHNNDIQFKQRGSQGIPNRVMRNDGDFEDF